MLEENRKSPFCNIYEIRCKESFEEIKQDVKDLKKVLIGNGNPHFSLVMQAELNTSHRKWMESWGKMILASFTVTAIGFIGSLIWIVYSYAHK